jgi:ERCC4-type nuclease
MILTADNTLIGVERKTIGDLLRVIADKRFVSEQLDGLLSTYNRVYLLVEGAFKPGPAGELLIRSGPRWITPDWGRRTGWTYAEVARWLISVTEGAGLQYQRTVTDFETATWLHELLAESRKKQVDRRALAGVYQPVIPSLAPPSFERRVAALLPGVGVEKSAAVASHFRSVAAMVAADEDDWQEIEGVGKTISRKIVSLLHRL